MIRGLADLSTRFRVLVAGAGVVTLGLALTQVPSASIDALPEFGAPRVEVQAEALGLSSTEVEQLITVPLEQDLLNGVPWLNRITSESVPGRSTIDLVFDEGTDVLKARQMVQEHLTQAHALPQVGTPPVMVQPVSSSNRVLMIGLGAKHLSLIDLSVLARWKIKPRLLGVPGVANVSIWGQRDRQLQVQVDPAALRRRGVSLEQVVSTTGNALWVSSLTFVEASTPGTGGFVDTANQRFAIQHVLPITTAKDLAGVSVEDTGTRHMLLGDLAKVVEDHQPLIGDAALDSGPGLMLVVEKFPGADVDRVTKAVEAAMADMAPGLSGVSIDTHVYRPATYVETALGNLGIWALAALVLLAAVLLAVLLSWRAALVALIATVLSVATAALVLVLAGVQLDAMVLAGLTAAAVVVVDEAVVAVDAVLRRLAGRTDRDRASSAAIIAEAIGDHRVPLVFATLAVLLVPLPALTLGGVAGSFARPVVLAYLLAVAAALLVALTVTPAVAVLLSGRRGLRRHDSVVAAGLERLHGRVARGLLRPRRLAATVAVLALAALAVVPQLVAGGGAMVPSLQDRDLLISWRAVPGTSLPEMTRITEAAAAELRRVPAVRGVGSHVGRAVMGDQATDVDTGETWVRLSGSADYRTALDDVTRVVRSYPGVRGTVGTYADARVRASSEAPAPVTVRVFGDDQQRLQATAEQVRQVLARIPGIRHPSVEQVAEQPAVQVRVDLAAAQKYGVKPGDVRRAAATYYAGLPVGSLYEDQKIFDVVVWGTPAARVSPSNVGDLLIDTPSGGHVRLADVADVRIGPSPAVIRHEDVSRTLDVTAAVSGDLGAVTDQVRERIRALPMPADFHLEVLGAAQVDAAEPWRLLGLALAVVVAVYLLLQAAFSSWRMAGLVLLAVPLACAGGVLTALLVGGVATLGALCGLLAVAGFALRADTVLMSALLADAERGAPSAESVLRVTRDRATPVLTTTAAAAVVLVPLLVLGSAAGTELLLPLAVVALGGLVTSAVVTLLVLPALYLFLARDRSRPAPAASPAEAPSEPARVAAG